MRCYGEFKDDRECDLCKRLDSTYYESCEEIKKETNKNNSRIHDIIINCPYRKKCWDDYNSFYGCIKDKEVGEEAPDCKPTLKCEQYILTK